MFLACRTSLVNCTCVIIKCIQSWVSAREFALLTADQYSEPAVTAKQFCIVRNTADWLFVARIINKWIKRRFQLLITRSISCFPIMFQLFVLLHNYIYWYCISSSTIEMYNFLVFPFYNIYIYIYYFLFTIIIVFCVISHCFLITCCIWSLFQFRYFITIFFVFLSIFLSLRLLLFISTSSVSFFITLFLRFALTLAATNGIFCFYWHSIRFTLPFHSLRFFSELLTFLSNFHETQ